MPTVLRKDGFEFRVYFNDHLPAHIHVFKAEGQAKIGIGADQEMPELLQVQGMSGKDAKRAVEIAIEHRKELLQKWEEIHG